jgi:ribosomal protein S18 acetylase RimI-like enzyme
MNIETGLSGVIFTEDAPVDVMQLNRLYRLIGWDRSNRRTVEATIEMLKVSRYHVAAVVPGVGLVGFARVCGDPYVAQVLDVITHPEYRRRGIATQCMRGVVEHLRRSKYVSVTLTA